jgi:hypothetical protein
MSNVDRAYRAKVWRAIITFITGFWFIIGFGAVVISLGLLGAL